MPARTKVNREEFAELAAKGWTNQQLAERYQVKDVTIWRARKATGTSAPYRLTPERKQRIAAMIADGWSFEEISRTEGAARDTLHRHFPGKQWTTRQRVEHQAALRKASTYHFNQRDDRWRQEA